MYRGRHRRVPTIRRLLAVPLLIAALSALVGPAGAAPRPVECRGSSPTVVWVSVSVTAGSIPAGETASFTFTLSRDGSVVGRQTVTLNDSHASGGVSFTGVSRGTYTVQEDTTGPFAPGPDQLAVVDPPKCAPVVSYTHSV